MQVIINGKTETLNRTVTVAYLVKEMNLKGKIAVEINQEILPHSQFDKYIINNGDKLEIVRAIGGG